jgi:simple sugar transport system substrate-binding protein
MKRLIPALALLTALLCGIAYAEQIRIVVVSHGQASDPFWSVVKNGVDQAAEDMNVKVEYRAPGTFDMVVMSQLIDAAVASSPDGLVVSIPDAAALGDAIKAAVAAGIPVVSMNSGADARKELGALIHVGQGEYEAGFGAGERMKAAGIKHGLCVNHEQGNVALELRCQGFEDGLGGKVDTLAVSTDPVEIRNAVAAFMAQHPDIDGILCVGPLSAEPTLASLEENHMDGNIQLATFDLSPDVLEAIGKGKMAFAIDQQQYLQGYVPIVTLALYKKYGLLPGADIQTGPGFVTKDNAEQVLGLSKQGIR